VRFVVWFLNPKALPIKGCAHLHAEKVDNKILASKDDCPPLAYLKFICNKMINYKATVTVH
jgi:hypothetical protein